MRRLLNWLLAVVLLARGAAAFDLARHAEIELVGPLANVVVSAVGGGRTRIAGELASGETRVIAVPIAQPDGSASPPTITFDADPDPSRTPGSARFLRWRAASTALASLGPGLRARARPALSETPIEISRAAPLLLVAAAILAVFLRRRPLATLAVAFGAAAALYPLVGAPVRDLAAFVTLVDGDTQATLWRRVDAALDELTIPAAYGDFTLESDPAEARVTWHVALDPARDRRVQARETRLFALCAVEVAEGTLSRSANRWAGFEDAWLREDGEWKRLGPWEFGAPLPGPAGLGPPPGWLASGLPQGLPILIARERTASGRSVTWVRVAGL